MTNQEAINEAKQKAMDALANGMMRLADVIRANHENAGQVASGKMRDSIRSAVLHDNEIFIGYVEALGYVETLELGNAPWDDIPTKTAEDGHTYDYVPEWFAETIGEWMANKGLQETKTFNRYVVAWNIIHEGTQLYRDGGRNDIYSEIVGQFSNEIADEIMQEYDTLISTITLNA